MSLGQRTQTTLYDVLGVSATSSRQEIKRQFYKLSLLYHPDVPGETVDAAYRHEKFIQISHAYQLLSDDLRRRDYDRQHGLGAFSFQNVSQPGLWTSASRHDMDGSFWTHRRHGDPDQGLTDEVMLRWQRWSEQSAQRKKEMQRTREASHENQRAEKSNSRNRLIAVFITVAIYLIFSSRTS